MSLSNFLVNRKQCQLTTDTTPHSRGGVHHLSMTLQVQKLEGKLDEANRELGRLSEEKDALDDELIRSVKSHPKKTTSL